MTNKLTKILAVGIMTIAPLFTGCRSDDAIDISLLDIKYHRKADILTPKKNLPQVIEKVYDNEKVLNQNKVTQETVNKFLDSTFERAYQNSNK